jgi:site-specific DNA recombinase
MAQSNRAHIYCRVSSTGQEDGYSLDTQEARCRDWCEQRGYSVASAVHEVRSGGDRHRPALDRIIAAVQPGDIVLAYALDRFSRDQIHTAALLDRIEQAGGSLELVTEDFEKSATGTFLRSAKAFAAELELEKIRERTSGGKRARVASGKPLVGARPRYGYLWNDEKTAYVLDPDTAPIVREIFDMALAGDSLKGMATRLQERGFPSPKGGSTWHRGRLRDLLVCPTYAGNVGAYRVRWEKDASGARKQRAGTDDEIVLLPGIAPAIVTEAEQGAVIARLAHNKATATRNNKQPEATLLRAGYVFCGVCGKAATVSNGRPSTKEKTRYETCRNAECGPARIVAADVDAAVWERVTYVLQNPKLIADAVGHYRQDGGLERELAELERRIAGNATKQTTLARNLALLSDAAAQPVIEQLEALALAAKTLEADRHALVRQMGERDASAAKLRTLDDWCAHVATKLEAATYAQKRLALDALGVRVDLYPKHAKDDNGEPRAPWRITMNPLVTAEPLDIATPSTGGTATR